MKTAHSLAYSVEDWPLLISELDEALEEAAPLKGFFAGGMTSVAEHERGRTLAVIREELRYNWEGKRPPTESVLDAMAKANDTYKAILDEHKEGRAKLHQLERRITILEHQIARIRALHFAAARLAGAGI